MAAHSGPGLSGNVLATSTSAQAVVSADDHRRTVVIQNSHASENAFIGGHTGAALTAANGFRLKSGESFRVDLPPFGEIYVIAGGTGEVRWLEFDGIPG